MTESTKRKVSQMFWDEVFKDIISRLEQVEVSEKMVFRS